MKKLLLLAILGAVAYFIFKPSTPTVVVNPVYVEFRVTYPDGIELVGFGKMDSQEDCELRAKLMWESVLASNGNAKVSKMVCVKELPSRYVALFNNQVANATYIALDRGNPGERDGRFIIYGAPSSEVMQICPTFITAFKSHYAGNVQCIQGKVG